MTLYGASHHFGVPWTTLKRYVTAVGENEQFDIQKLGRPFALNAATEIKLVNYIIAMQELGFGVTVVQVREVAWKLAHSTNRDKFLHSPKVDGFQIASKTWWRNFKQRYNLSLRVPENLSAYRASMANPTMVADFYVKLENLMKKINIFDKPNRIWNCDETGLAYVTKSSKVVCQVGKKYVYRRTWGERGETHTVLACACADGTWIPPFIIFKGTRWSDLLARNKLPNSIVTLSPKGWITKELFLVWFKFFVESVPAERPLILLMDSHSSHISPDVIELAKANYIYLFIFPAHCSHLLQPLDVGVYKPLKAKWYEEINKHMRANPLDKPNRYNFLELFNPAYLHSFSHNNITGGFKKTGIFPFNKFAISPDALKPSALTERTEPVQEPREPIEKILELPSAERPNSNKLKKRKVDSSAKCLNVIDSGPSCSYSTPQKLVKPTTLQSKKSVTADDDWSCRICNTTYSSDVKKKNGKQWIQCSFCCYTYHETCQSQKPDQDTTVYMCDSCYGEDDDSTQQ